MRQSAPGTIFVLLLFVSCFTFTESSYYNPHVYPARGPFFEGWYVRITDHTEEQSVAVLFGAVLKKDTSSKLPSGLVSILHSNGTRPLVAYNHFLKDDDVEVTVDGGKPVQHDPDARTPADFKWEAKGCGYLRVRPESAYLNFTVQDFTLFANISSAVPWDLSGRGPEGWLNYLPLPLNWFVYSTRSVVTEYGWESRAVGGKERKGTGSGLRAVAHMEKNWGKSFPTAWYWGQGTKSDGVYFAMCGGPVDFGPVTVNGHLVGYRNGRRGIHHDYRPDNSITKIKMDSCAGVFNITIESFVRKLEIAIQAPVETLSDCLYGPGENGFYKACIESFFSTANIRVYERRFSGFGRLVEIDRQTIPNSAVEFGGSYVCNQKCG